MLVGLFGAGEVASKPSDLAHLVVALGSTRDMDAGQVLADPDGLVLGALPRSPDLEDLGAVNPADAGEQDRGRERLQPSLGGGGPFVSATDVGKFVTGRHQVAIDVACPLGTELVRE